jgi:monoamine oxidase
VTLDLLVIGAGAAGIAAARAALAAGRSVRVLEARGRVGGRALTDTEALGEPFDLGATWLHAAERNPLVKLAPGVGVTLVDSDALRREVTFIGTRRITPAEDADYDAAWQAFDAAIHARAAAGPDVAASEGAPRGGPWDATVASWQGDVIAAWPLAGMSLHDFAATLLEGGNRLPEGGLGHAIKVGLRAAGEDRLGLPDHASTDRRVAAGELLVPITFWPRGRPIAHGWIGGTRAEAIEREGPAAAEALVREEIAARLGSAAPAAFRPGALVSTWGRDPFSRGVYSHARIGAAGARAVLAAPLAGGRLCFAGEACHKTLAGTVGGAWLTGEAAAQAALAAA